MFARSLRGAFISVKFQSNLTRQSEQVLGRTNNASWSRWQSTAAARVEDDADLDHPQDEAPSAQVEHIAKRKRDHRFRNWRPSVQLGVQALGKPAEVLLLSPRDRKIPIVPSDERDVPQKLQESLDAELQSVGPEQVRQNIEQLREQFCQTQMPLSDEKWQKLRQGLSSGFTKDQLASYIRQMQPRSLRDRRLNTSRGNWKQQMATHIVKNIWRYTTRDAGDDSPKANVEASVKFKRHYLDVLLLHRSRLQTICEKNNVLIDIFHEDGNVVVLGTPENVAAGKAAVVTLRDSLRKGTLFLENDSSLSEIWKEGQVQDFLRALEQRYGVHLTHRGKGFSQREEPSLDIVYCKDDKDIMASIRREILLNIQSPQEPPKHVSWPMLAPQSECIVPVYLGHGGCQSHERIRWGRISSKDNTDLTSSSSLSPDENDALVSVIQRNIRDHLRKDSLPPLKRYVHKEIIAHFGQVLHDRSPIDLKLERLVENEVSPSRSQFSSTIALLSQFTSSLDKWTPNSGFTKTNVPDEIPHPAFLFRISLIPVKRSSRLPAIEILLSGQDYRLGLSQNLKVQRVQAILRERACNLLLPNLPVDVRLISQIKLDLYLVGQKQPSEHRTLLNQLRTFLEQAAGRDEPSFPSFVELNLRSDPELHQWATDVQNLPGESKAESTVAPTQSSVVKHHLGAVEYMLRTAEQVENTTFRLPFAPKLCLNQTTIQGGKYGDDSQILTLTTGPSFGHQMEKVGFHSFFKATYQMALRLGKSKIIRERPYPLSR